MNREKNGSSSVTKSAEIDEITLDLIHESDSLRLRNPPYPGIIELAKDLKERGQTTPLFVRPKGEGFELISGYRRLDALRFINAPTALCRIYRDLPGSEAYDLAISENRDRESLTDLERAEICVRLQREGKTIEQIATRMGWTSERNVYNHLRVAREASPALRTVLQNRKIDFKVALVLVEEKTAQLDESIEREILQTVIENDMSARDTKAHLARVTKRRAGGDAEVPSGRADTGPNYIREYGNGGFMLSARIDPRDPGAVMKALEVIEAALKRGRQLKKRLATAS